MTHCCLFDHMPSSRSSRFINDDIPYDVIFLRYLLISHYVATYIYIYIYIYDVTTILGQWKKVVPRTLRKYGRFLQTFFLFFIVFFIEHIVFVENFLFLPYAIIVIIVLSNAKVKELNISVTEIALIFLIYCLDILPLVVTHTLVAIIHLTP